MLRSIMCTVFSSFIFLFFIFLCAPEQKEEKDLKFEIDNMSLILADSSIFGGRYYKISMLAKYKEEYYPIALFYDHFNFIKNDSIVTPYVIIHVKNYDKNYKDHEILYLKLNINRNPMTIYASSEIIDELLKQKK